MFNLTNKAKNHFLNFFKNEEAKDEEFKNFCKSRI
jgi:hypothetical protein